MKVGMIGLGRMGGNMTERLRQHDHEVVSYARSGGGTADSVEDLVSQLEPPRVVWMMIPAGAPTEETFKTLLAQSAVVRASGLQGRLALWGLFPDHLYIEYEG